MADETDRSEPPIPDVVIGCRATSASLSSKESRASAPAVGRVGPSERDRGITVLLWREHRRTYAPRAFADTVCHLEQSAGLPPREPSSIATWAAHQRWTCQLLQEAAPEHVPGASTGYDAECGPDRVTAGIGFRQREGLSPGDYVTYLPRMGVST